jgi:DNA-binding PadR family transcriptional regulator
MSDLSSTSYAILGLLAARPWSAYELTQYMRGSNLRAIWPRAASKLYEEPKKLRSHGLATAEEQVMNGRKRTVYTITPEGRRALASWLDEPSAGLATEFEAMLKVAHATEGSVEQLLRTVVGVRERLVESVPAFHHRIDDLLADGFTLPERTHTSALVLEFVNRILMAVAGWSTWAESQIRDWQDTANDEAKAERAQRVYRDLRDQLDSIQKLVAAREDESG